MIKPRKITFQNRLTTKCKKVAGGGIEPPTPGFSVVPSETPLSIVTRELVIDCDAGGCQPKNSAQQKAQHIQGDVTADEEWEALRQLWPKIGIEGRRQLVRFADDASLLQMEDL